MSKYRRLTMRNNNIIDTNCKNCKQCKKVGRKYICNDMTACDEEIINRLAELEDKIENGTLIEMPCKVGDTVWCLIAQGRLGTIYTTGEAIPRKVNKIMWDGHKIEIYSERLNYYNNGSGNECNYYGYFGETIFLNKPEAEAKLRELKGD